ncbi:pyrimidine reductase family protein [Streptomyces sp. NPDC001443]
MRRLFPVTDETAAPASDQAREAPAGGPAGVGREWSLDELATAYAYPERTPGAASGTGGPSAGPRPWLRANMVSTLDGAAQHDGRSQPISNAADMRIFGTLRALADVVLVGAETVRQEGYRPARARAEFAERRAGAGQAPAPAVAVVSARLDLDFSLPLFTAPLVPTLILTGAAAPRDRIAAAEKAGARVLIAGDGAGVDPARAVRALAGLGHTRLLTEGGPRLLGQLVAAGVLDELCLTVSPMLTAGAAQRIAGGPPVTVPSRFALVSLLEEDGFLFSRYRRV